MNFIESNKHGYEIIGQYSYLIEFDTGEGNTEAANRLAKIPQNPKIIECWNSQTKSLAANGVSISGTPNFTVDNVVEREKGKSYLVQGTFFI